MTMHIDRLKARFAAPDPRYGPVPFWWWSGDRIVERGKHQELLAQNGLYRELYEKQLKAMKPEELLRVSN